MKLKRNKKLVRLIIEAAKQISRITEKETGRKERGRPRQYPNYIFIAALLLKQLENLSLRELEERLKELFPNSPDHTTLWYRFRKLSKEYLEELIKQSAKQIKESLKAKEFFCIIADGTGFGYADTYKLSYKRGKELREVKSHVKTEVLIGLVRRKLVVLDVNVGSPYADEVVLLNPMLNSLEFRARYFLGDAYYDKVSVLKKVKDMNMHAVVPVKDTLRKKVRNPYRLWAKKNYEEKGELYRKHRASIERIIGMVKNAYGDRDWVKDFHVASLYVLAKFALYNLALLIELLLLCFYLLKLHSYALRFSMLT